MPDYSMFSVQIAVNGNGEHIGKNYDVEVPGVLKAFRIDKRNSDYLDYKYYMGDWSISEYGAKNWKIISPLVHQTPANHLRADAYHDDGEFRYAIHI